MSGGSNRPDVPPDEPPQAGLPTTSSTRKPALSGDHNLDIETADTARLPQSLADDSHDHPLI